MSRVIKFRAWDKEGVYKNRYGQMEFGRYFPKRWVTDRGLERYEIMQFTGLTDKKGKEVYEDDIIKENENELTALLHYLQDMGGYTLYITGRGPNGMTNMPFSRLDTTNFEVIGNIYENPGLLKK